MLDNKYILIKIAYQVKVMVDFQYAFINAVAFILKINN